MIKKRYIHNSVADDLKEKMVFIGGPRQVGKTTVAHFIGENEYHSYEYLNWDSRSDRKKILEERFTASAELIIFDEIHKYKKWKNYIKGIFDTHKERFKILVTGSARLDLYRKGGDSLMGRYHYFRLHPFSLREVLSVDAAVSPGKELNFLDNQEKMRRVFNQLFVYGGFPEPFLSKDTRTLRRFHNEYVDRLVREDIRDVEMVRDISALNVLVELLEERVGSLLSLNALREDIEVAHKTIALWMDILERFYYHFRIYPFVSRKIRSLKKEPKMYLWDWSRIDDKSVRLENIVASHLLKFIHFLYDREGYRAELNFLRDRDGREVDFLVTLEGKPWFAVEVKQSAEDIPQSLRYFADKLQIPFVYLVVHTEGVDEIKGRVRIISVDKFLSGLV